MEKIGCDVDAQDRNLLQTTSGSISVMTIISTGSKLNHLSESQEETSTKARRVTDTGIVERSNALGRLNHGPSS